MKSGQVEININVDNESAIELARNHIHHQTS